MECLSYQTSNTKKQMHLLVPSLPLQKKRTASIKDQKGCTPKEKLIDVVRIEMLIWCKIFLTDYKTIIICVYSKLDNLNNDKILSTR